VCGRIEFLFVRTGRSPSAALHLVFGFGFFFSSSFGDAVAFSYGPVSACPTGTFTPLVMCACGRTSRRLAPAPHPTPPVPLAPSGRRGEGQERDALRKGEGAMGQERDALRKGEGGDGAGARRAAWHLPAEAGS
jgi:hypothetical protein